jgi:hypothetical protein
VVGLLVASLFVATLVVATARREERGFVDAPELVGARMGSSDPVGYSTHLATADSMINVQGMFGEAPDLPCPWCESPTREEDNHCPSCGQRFG